MTYPEQLLERVAKALETTALRDRIPPTTAKCETCHFWRPRMSEQSTTGLCHYYPPQADGLWPITQRTDWCGEWTQGVKKIDDGNGHV